MKLYTKKMQYWLPDDDYKIWNVMEFYNGFRKKKNSGPFALIKIKKESSLIEQGYILQPYTILPSSPTPTRFPSPPSLSLPAGRSSLPSRPAADARRAGSCRRRGCRGWNTCPAGGVGPGGRRRRGPGPAGGWAAGSPRPAEPRSRCHPAGLSSTGRFRGAAPGEEKRGHLT